MTTLIPKFKQPATGAVNRPINEKLNEIPSLSDFDTNANFQTYALTLTQPVDHAVKPESVVRTLSSKLKDIASILDFGGVADGVSSTGAGTDNTAAFQLAITTLGSSGSLYIPEGVYMIHSQISVPSGFSIIGAGAYNSILCAPTAFNSDGLFKFSGAGGPPTSIMHVAVLAQNGGCGPASVGLNMAANGSYAENIWCGGFATTVAIGSSSCFFYNSVIDTGISSGTGLYISAGAVIVANVQVYNNYTGVEIASTNPTEPVTISNLQVIQCPYQGIVIDSATNIHLDNCSCTSIPAAFSNGALRIANSSKVNVSNFVGRLTTKNTSVVGIYILDSSELNISNSQLENWRYGIQCTGGSSVIINGNISSSNAEYGIAVAGGDRITISNNTCIANGDTLSTTAGISTINNSGYAIYNVVGNICSQNGGGVQNYGIKADILNNGAASGFTNLVGNIAKYNTTANISTTGVTANISSTGNVV